jgi:hypothetical protein
MPTAAPHGELPLRGEGWRQVFGDRILKGAPKQRHNATIGMTGLGLWRQAGRLQRREEVVPPSAKSSPGLARSELWHYAKHLLGMRYR